MTTSIPELHSPSYTLDKSRRLKLTIERKREGRGGKRVEERGREDNERGELEERKVEGDKAVR